MYIHLYINIYYTYKFNSKYGLILCLIRAVAEIKPEPLAPKAKIMPVF